MKDLTAEKLEEAMIDIYVHHHGFFKGDVIGLMDLTMSKVYNMKDHTCMHQKMGLVNPNGADSSKVSGEVTVSINV